MNPQHFFARAIEPKLLEALQDTPIVLLAGPRQAGKTTLVKQVTQEKKLRFLTLDDELTRLSAKEDPEGLIRSLDYVVIDEIQRAPELLLAIKKSVDEDRRPGSNRNTQCNEKSLEWCDEIGGVPRNIDRANKHDDRIDNRSTVTAIRKANRNKCDTG